MSSITFIEEMNSSSDWIYVFTFAYKSS